MRNILKKIYGNEGQDRLLPRLSLFVFDHSRIVAVLWLCLTVFGIVSYTNLMKREGFPSVNIPVSLVSGTYFVNDPKKVDKDVAKPISDIVLKDSRVKTVQSQSLGTFYSIIIQLNEGTDANKVNQDLDRRIKESKAIPKQATHKVESPKFGFTERGDDGVVSLFAKNTFVPLEDMVVEANKVVSYIKSQKIANLESISVIDPFIVGVDPATGQEGKAQVKFDRYGERAGSENKFYDSVAIGYMQNDGTDVISMDDRLQSVIASYNQQHSSSPFKAVVSASYAHDIKDQISELQRALFEGLLAVLIVGSIIIAIRASLITVLSMLSVIAITLAVLYSIGYTLNTITLFALILCLGLIVDDTIIMGEAIDAQRRRLYDPRKVIQVATRKVSRAMVAATFTAALSFAPLIFVSGVLGSFIRAIPITVIISLMVSLIVALIFIPLFARYLLLRKKQMGAKNVNEPAAGVEAKIAQFAGKPMLWARNSRAKLVFVGLTAVLIGFAFIGAGGYLFQKVTFNIFPPSKDSNGLSVQMLFPPSTPIGEAEATADRANEIVGNSLSGNFKTASYYSNASAVNANLIVNLVAYTERDVSSPKLQAELNNKFKDFEGAKVEVSQLDVGPPSAVFSVRIQSDNREASLRLAKDVNAFLLNRELVRLSGDKAKITSTAISDPGIYTRKDGALYVDVTAKFDATDTTTLVTLAKSAVEKEFTSQKLRTYGLGKDVLKFDLGQEQENQDSFKTLAFAFPVLLLAIYLLLAIQFRSLAQPLLIFMAIPFSLFGITLGLYLTDNAFSFFAMLGFFALIGLSLKNTILLTDYANQLRQTGSTAVDAAVGALQERFRPLVATSLTAVASLIPLAISSPFWEGLTVVLIFGLLSSTFLVITVFPYYYLGAEFVRLRISRKACLAWLVITIALSAVLVKSGISPGIIPIVAIGVSLLLVIASKLLKRSSMHSA